MTAPRSSIAWGPADRAAMRAWSARTGRPAVELVDDALDRIATDPVTAVADARAWMTAPAGGAVPVPLVGAHHARFVRAAQALDGAFGSVLPVAPVVRALVRKVLAAA